jgi:hypothetical protein
MCSGANEFYFNELYFLQIYLAINLRALISFNSMKSHLGYQAINIQEKEIS